MFCGLSPSPPFCCAIDQNLAGFSQGLQSSDRIFPVNDRPIDIKEDHVLWRIIAPFFSKLVNREGRILCVHLMQCLRPKVQLVPCEGSSDQY